MSVFLLSIVAIGRVIHINDIRYAFITNPIMLEFLLGVIICESYLKLTVAKWMPWTLILLGTMGYLCSIIGGYGDIFRAGAILNGELSMMRFIKWGIPSACLVAGFIFSEKQGSLKNIWKNKWLRLIGDASYSLYLVHLTVFLILKLIYSRVEFPLNADLSVSIIKMNNLQRG